AVTGRSLSDRDFRSALDSGILLCELLSSIRPGLVRKINRLPTPVAAQENVALFLKGCEELGLKGSQLFDPGDLLDTSSCTYKGQDNNKKLKNVAEEGESPKRSIRDSGYIDCWESERSHSLSPPRHTRDDSFDSLDSIGSCSHQTPSPDGLLAHGYSDGRGSDSECDTPQRKIPDVRKDDMLVRRTSCSEPRNAVPFNQYLPNRTNQGSYVPVPVRCPRIDRDESRKSWSNATSPVGGERPFSVMGTNASNAKPLYSAESPRNDSYPQEPHSISPPSDPQICSLLLKKHPSAQLSHSDHDKEDDEEKDRNGWATICQNHPKPADTQESDVQISKTETAGDDSRSVSMIDMRSEEDLPPHSQIRHELMHNQYNKQKEEEDHWQDDLAKWKSRRRSVSQDLIKKEEERKMMERLLSEDGGSQRRKSIKTYREIVEEKERREEELHDAYQRACTPEEAAAVLQRYAQRFTISEAVLDRLKVPKQLERSVSADPTHITSHFISKDISRTYSNPLQYLRQQSLPATKFTSTVEALVTGYTTEHGKGSELEGILDPAHSYGTVSSLGPKAYRPSTVVAAGMETSKMDEPIRVNGERGHDLGPKRNKEEEEDSLRFFSTSLRHTDADINSNASALKPTHTPERSHKDRETPEIKRGTGSLVSNIPGRPAVLNIKPVESVEDQEKTVKSCVSDAVLNLVPVDNAGPVRLKMANTLPSEIPQKSGEHLNMAPQQTSPELAASAQLSPLSSNPTLRRDFFTADDRAHENERYQREQEKLKQEWEQAQKEVQEQDRSYQEKEQKVLEAIVSPQPPNCEPHSTFHSPTDGEHQHNPGENQRNSEKYRARENNVSEAAQRPTESSQQKLDSPLQSCRSESQRGQGEQNTLESCQDMTPANRQIPMQNETGKSNPTQPKAPGRKRSDAIENTGAHSSPSLSFIDTQAPPSPNRSVSGKKLCSSCGHPLGKGAAMIIETLSLYFHIQCFKCGICKGQLGDTSTGTDVRIRNGLLNCHQCYVRSRSSGQPTTL
ncbi:hypothetical protein DNTS_006231, partial [Danionella cerebrum]